MISRQGRQPQRTCIACRRTADQNELVRFVLGPDGALLVDYRHKLPGRGAYTCLNRECLGRAVEKRQFQRSFRGQAESASAEALLLSLQEQVLARVEALLGMARKSGQLETGTNSVLDSLRKKGKFAVLILSEDISESIGEKLTAVAARQDVPVFNMLGKNRIGQLLGKSERSAVAIKVGALADAILIELQRLAEMVREN
ncbi:MAG: DUF448 domain-containing protein [Desulfuromonadales bacterium]|nr:DUF448 domain-containing protein [Desulfuromonadales bacterium]